MSSTQVTEEFRNISLSVKISKAKLNVSVAKFGQMNPYAVVRFQDQSLKSSVISDGGISPVWNDCFFFEVCDFWKIKIDIYHSAFLINDIKVGSCQIKEKQLIDGKFIGWVGLENNAGSVFLTVLAEEDKKLDQKSMKNNIIDSLATKIYEMELHKEEAHHLKMKFKRKQEKLNQQKRLLRKRLQGIPKENVTIIMPIKLNNQTNSNVERTTFKSKSLIEEKIKETRKLFLKGEHYYKKCIQLDTQEEGKCNTCKTLIPNLSRQF